MEQTLRELTPVSAVLKGAWAKYKRRFGDLAWIALPPALITAIGDYLATFGGALRVFGGLITALGVVAAILSAVALVYAVRNDKQFDESYKYAFKNFFPYLWVALLTFLAGLGGIFLGVIPALIFAVWFSFVCYIFVSEGDRGLPTLLKSKEYARGYFWPIVWRLLVTVLISMIVGIAASALGASLGLVGAGLASIVTQIALTPFVTVYVYALYQDLARVKPELVGTKVEENRKFFTYVNIWGIAATIILIVVLLATIGFQALRNLGKYSPEGGLVPQNTNVNYY